MKKKSKKKSKKKKFIIIAIILVVTIIIQTLPVLFPKPLGSESIVDENVILYYQKGDEKGANEVFDLLKEESDSILSKMKFENNEVTEVYLYKTQWQLAIREAGFVTLIIAPPWHIGDSHNGNVMMVSPYAPVEVHTHDSILTATLHEFVHSINFQINPELSYFWDNGIATYLSDQEPEDDDLYSRDVPTLDEMHTDNGLEFAEMGGYAFSYNYIEYLDDTYGWDSILEYVSGNGSYEEIFNKSEEEIYNDWCDNLEESSSME
ncbi:MAG: hypothetical protein PF513_06455 [Tenericutes bacterium]|jgi:hypothetical protein|nr:hypothetical protein [Mycoplasmatota bacterium]